MVRNHKNASCGSTRHIRPRLADLLYQGSRSRSRSITGTVRHKRGRRRNPEQPAPGTAIRSRSHNRNSAFVQQHLQFLGRRPGTDSRHALLRLRRRTATATARVAKIICSQLRRRKSCIDETQTVFFKLTAKTKDFRDVKPKTSLFHCPNVQ